MQFGTFDERFNYLKLNGIVGEVTFDFNRYLNQTFYKSRIWIDEIRPKIITRDLGCDLGIPDAEIFGKIIIHHINPITVDDVINNTDLLTNPEYLICASDKTHRAIHYGDISLLTPMNPVIRYKNDTCPWKWEHS